ncbi:MAG: M48 family metalloprotease [Planctomycetes bacterium]|nr:M48 family metalloprotease [Planctomycetota bacterium]
MFLVVIGVLSVILAFPRPLYSWVTSPALIGTVVAAAVLLPALMAGLAARRTLRLLELKPSDPGEGQFWFGRGMLLTQIVLAVTQIGLLICTDWSLLCRRTPMVGQWPVVPGVLSLLPFLLGLLLVWVVAYPADRAVRQIALEIYLFRGKPVRPVWPLGTYLLYNFRHQVLFILIPLLLILAARDVIELYQTRLQAIFGQPFMPDVLLGASAGLVAIIAPVIVRYVWVTERLPDGPLRDQLLMLGRKLRVRCREILVWHSGGMIVNAAVMGIIAPLRYVLITDAMLEQMDDRKIEAVFGHEAGHVKRHHILYYLLFALISGCLITVFSVRGRQFEQRETYQIVATIGAGVLLLKWGVVFGWISRRFERQADLFGARALVLTGLPCVQPCALHGNHVAPDAAAAAERVISATQPTDLICATAAHVFSDALNEVAVLNGIAPEARSWRHSSISSRSRFLQRLARDPTAFVQFERVVYRCKVAILLTAIAMSVWAAYELRIWTLLSALRRLVD